MTTALTRKSLEPFIKDEIIYKDYQIEGIRQLARWKSFILGDDMGLGKSLQSLTVFGMDVIRGWAETLLIVAPVTLKGNWEDEVEKFTRFPSVTLSGPPKTRAQQLDDFAKIVGPKILIVNYEQVIPHEKELDAFMFDAIVFDEAHYLKNPKAKRTKACQGVYSRRSFLLTGTPMLNHVNELWSLLHRVDPAGYPNYYSFISRYCVFGGWKDKQIIGVKNELELTERLQAVMLRRLSKDVLDLEEPQFIERRVDLHPEQAKLYNEVLNDLKLQRAGEPEPDDIENALTKFLRLKQICGTTHSFTEKDDSSKLDLAIEDALEILGNGHKLIVFTQFRDIIACYAERMKAHGYAVYQLHGDVKQADRQPIVATWSQQKEPAVIVCMIQVAGVGLNMVAARHMQFIDKLFVPGLNMQAVKRAHRIGQDAKEPVQVFEYICRNTIENRVQQILKTKSNLFGQIVETDPDWKKKLYKALMEDAL